MLLRSASKCSCSILVFLVLLCPTLLLAQKITGDIAGDVTDSSGAVVPNATVTAVSAATGLTRTVTTSGSGSYRLPELPIGSYKVSSEAQGFKTAVQSLEVSAGAV